MNKYLLLIATGFFLMSNSYATEQIAALSPSDSEYLEVYESFKSSSPVKEVARSELQLPLTIQDSQNGYLKVNINSHVYWVKAAKVRVKRDVSASCGAALTAERVGSTPGLSGNTCR